MGESKIERRCGRGREREREREIEREERQREIEKVRESGRE